MTIHLGRPLPDASRDRPERRRGNPLAGLLSQDAGVPSLFGLAPGGVYRAVAVAGDAVRSYRTLSPLPAGRSPSAVCFLWHCPWGRPRRVLPGTVFPWSPDFPPPPPRAAKAVIRPSGALDDSRETALSKIGATDATVPAPGAAGRSAAGAGVVRRRTLAKIGASPHRQLAVRIGDPELDRTVVCCCTANPEGSSVGDRPMATELEPLDCTFGP
jgi:hypothetical protein